MSAYTEADLRAEAARQHRVHVTAFDSDVVLRHLLDAPVESTRSDSDVLTWDEALNCGEFDEPTAAVVDLIQGAADLSRWAVDLGAFGLRKTTELAWGHPENWDLAVQIAHRPGVAPELHEAVVAAVRDAVTAALEAQGIPRPLA